MLACGDHVSVPGTGLSASCGWAQHPWEAGASPAVAERGWLRRDPDPQDRRALSTARPCLPSIAGTSRFAIPVPRHAGISPAR